ncbi:F510_1955 family glycosylhydrolase [Actinomadura kijaniata]|uniref:F510_1955 family glycosylhydrolase n=1 Tax=Actinomadura kijaniata TaxID=46161 RepID=UPI00082CE363|nr:sialidase family protein [Actinomadura kijaniata]
MFRSRRSRVFPRTRLASGAAITILASLGLAACAGDKKHPAPTQSAVSQGFGHVHGIGVDPADGAVYVGAHHGVFRVAGPGQAVRVAGRVQDTMGFAVIGPRTFLASGHPAITEISKGVAPHLGLIRSEDAGNTWTAVSEQGRGDFHSIQPAGRNLYVHDNQTGHVRRSGDQGRTWVLGARLEAVDLAAGRDRPDRVYATTPQGVQVSDDGGTTFKTVVRTPVLTHLDVTGGGLVGVDPEGRTYASRPDGSGWQARGRVPGAQVSAFTAVDDRRLLAAVDEGTLYESRNGGYDFTLLYRPPTR